MNAYKIPSEDELFERELSDEELAQFKPIKEVAPAEMYNVLISHQREMEAKGLIKPRGKQKAPTKQAITIRLSPVVIEKFKATGKGWQTRINEALLQYVQRM